MRSEAPDAVRVLVVDDDDLFARMIVHLVSSEDDFELVGRAGDGGEGVELALEHRPDLIVMDVHMPVLDGFQATKRLRKLGVDADVLLVSGEDVSAHVQGTGAGGSGAIGYMSKSEVPSRLLPTLRAIAAARRSRS
jgi:DNA-binding NarL/FixJ family response regulator